MNALVMLLIAHMLANTEPPAAAADASQPGALPLSLSWSAPAGCPDEDAVREAIRGRVSANVKPAAPIEARAVISAGPAGRFRLRLHTRVDERDGERTISHEDCSQLAQAAALVIALLIDPNASVEPVTPPPPAPAPRPDPPLPAPAPSAPVPTVRKPFRRTAVGIEGDVAYGRLPGVAGGGHVRVGREGEHVGAELRAGAWLPSDKAAPQPAGAGGRFWMADLGAGLCLHTAAPAAWGVQSCAGGRASWMTGKSYGVTSPGSTSAWLLSAYLSAGIRVRLSDFLVVRWRIEGALQPSRPWFEINGVGNIYKPPVASAGSSLGFDVIF